MPVLCMQRLSPSPLIDPDTEAGIASGIDQAPQFEIINRRIMSAGTGVNDIPTGREVKDAVAPATEDEGLAPAA